MLLGQNSYALTLERLRWTRAFKEKHGIENLASFPAKEATFRQLRDEVSVAPFIAEKRLIVVEGVPKGTKGEAKELVQSMHPDVLLLFVLELDPTRKAKLTILQKEIKELSQCMEFPLLSLPKLQQWIRESVAEQGASITQSALLLLVDLIGEDQYLLSQEVRKIALFAHGREIQEEDVRTMVACSTEREVWKLMDFLGAGNVEEALQYVHSLLERGLSPQALWSTFLWMLSLLVQVVSLVEEGETNAWTIARELHAYGSSIQAILPFARKMDRAFLIRILDHALEADRGLKTGVYKATSEAPQELLALIDRSILSFV